MEEIEEGLAVFLVRFRIDIIQADLCNALAP
jgi:hypothetical protein